MSNYMYHWVVPEYRNLFVNSVFEQALFTWNIDRSEGVRF